VSHMDESDRGVRRVIESVMAKTIKKTKMKAARSEAPSSKSAGDSLDKFLDMMDDPDYW